MHPIPSVDHELSIVENYTEQGKVIWDIAYSADERLLLASYNAEGTDFFEIKIPLDPTFLYFDVFAWADKTTFELAYNMQILPVREFQLEEVTELTVGRICFRLGSMFDDHIRRKSDIIILPVSSEATMTSNIRKKSIELNFPYAPPKPLGTFDVRSLKRKEPPFYAGFAYSVKKNKSDALSIRNLAKRILQGTGSIKNGRHPIQLINLPLLGAGAGNLDPIVVAAIFDEEFNIPGDKRRFIVSILSREIFLLLTNQFNGRFFVPETQESAAKPAAILELEKIIFTTIDWHAFECNHIGEVIRIELNGQNLNSFDLARKFPNLEVLSLIKCQWENYASVGNLKKLHSLNLSQNKLQDYSFLTKLRNLRSLNLHSNGITNIAAITPLKNLQTLQMNNNSLTDLHGINALKKLQYLDLSKNQFQEVHLIGELTALTVLDLSDNNIFSVAGLKGLKRLHTLLLANNNIIDADALQSLASLHYLDVYNNPFLSNNNLLVYENDNHLVTVKNILLKASEENKKEITLPAKILLLGNHASGKSSLLQYLQTGSLALPPESTHIIKIEKFPTTGSAIPEAIFFDFGGQDYYHGIYRAFLSAGSLYVILWNASSDQNSERPDKGGILTQDFTLSYWLCQKQFLENKRFRSDPVPALLIQTHADENKKKSFPNTDKLHDIQNEFFVSLAAWKPQSENDKKWLVNKLALDYLKGWLRQEMELHRQTLKQPGWYEPFLTYILTENTTASHEGKKLETDILPHYLRDEDSRMEFLKEDLDQLHRHGLVLYYKNELPDTVWLNPVALVDYVHNKVLNREKIRISKGHVPVPDFASVAPDIIRLLELQKVIFKDVVKQEYIVPNFLPLASENMDEFDLFTFDLGLPVFVMKFECFLPFGLMNQIVRVFGTSKEVKKFWRDQILFTFEKRAKVLIRLDFKYLEIKVYAYFVKSLGWNETEEIKKYLFYAVAGLYWDIELLNFEKFISFIRKDLSLDDMKPGDNYYSPHFYCKEFYENLYYRQEDLYVSIDDRYFVGYQKLCSSRENPLIQAQVINESRVLEKPAKFIDIHSFNCFTHRPFPRRKRIAISYSKKDLDMVGQFQRYLFPLKQDGLIENPWTCTQLIAGDEWDEVIQKKFNEADIIFFMISEHLITNKYVLENEIKTAIERSKKDKNVRIVPILLVPYPFELKEPYNLAVFTGLPYTMKPVSSFADEHEAWDIISACVRIMVESDNNPASTEAQLTEKLFTEFQKIVDKQKRQS